MAEPTTQPPVPPRLAEFAKEHGLIITAYGWAVPGDFYGYALERDVPHACARQIVRVPREEGVPNPDFTEAVGNFIAGFRLVLAMVDLNEARLNLELIEKSANERADRSTQQSAELALQALSGIVPKKS